MRGSAYFIGASGGDFMELSEFAGRVLLSASLDEKIADPDELTDFAPQIDFVVPSRPARSERLSLDVWKNSAKIPFPTRSDLLRPEQVGVLLHFFANHELLALELMALALLKFPDAPSSFRLGIAHTMRDEQRHLRAYISRMNDFGVEFGDLPLNDFFWSQCSSMHTPMDYVSRMSLTFEQANLDFAAYFRDVLQETGDHSTASLLDTVLADEMAHVRHGLNWFRRWKTGNETDWQAFCLALGTEINPSRAKGMIFRTDYRREVGLDEDYISQLRIFSQSKGRPPRAMFFNPEAEEDVRASGGRSPVLSRALAAARDDLSPVMLFLSSQADLVILPRSMPTGFLLALRDAGFLMPEICTGDLSEAGLKEILKGRKISGLVPWSVSPTSQRVEKYLDAGSESVFCGSADDLRWIHSKASALGLLAEYLDHCPENNLVVDPGSIGMVIGNCGTFDEFIKNYSVCFPDDRFVAKRPLSASGRHRIYGTFRDGGWQSQPEITRQWFKKSWQTGEIPVVQPYFERVVDLSVQARIDCSGRESTTIFLGMTRVLNSGRGQYLGSCVGRFLNDAEPELLKFFYGKSCGRSPEEILRDIALWTGKRLSERGYRGSFGIDAFVFRDKEGGLRLFPMIEINSRHTMGRVALALSKRTVPGRSGLWLHITRPMLDKLNARTFEELRDRWKADFPVIIFQNSGGFVISGGLLETTPAEQSSSVWTCFLVSKNVQSDLRLMGLEKLFLFSGDGPTTDTPAKLP